MELTFVSRVAKPKQDPIQNAIDLISEQKRKTPYDSKEKWLKFGVSVDEPSEAMQFLKTLRSRMASQLRRQYGSSRQLDVQIVVDDGEPTLYVHTDAY
jgi:hypothetical protein